MTKKISQKGTLLPQLLAMLKYDPTNQKTDKPVKLGNDLIYRLRSGWDALKISDKSSRKGGF